MFDGYHPERWGFCNDKFCPKCWSTFTIIKNGQLKFNNQNITWEDIASLQEQGEDIQKLVDENKIVNVDIHGCKKCEGNQDLIHQGVMSEGGEYDGQKTCAKWFKDNQHMWRN